MGPITSGAVPSRSHRVLFLQGPASSFLWHVAQILRSQGATVHRILLCLGDRVFWPGQADWFRGRFADWRDFLAEYLVQHDISSIVLLGDCRPYHQVAVSLALSKAIDVHVVEHGYLRPCWLTIEPDGMNSFSRFPRTRHEILELSAMPDAVGFDLGTTVWHESFLRYALQDIAFNIPDALFGWIAVPHYRRYASVSCWTEYGGWCLKGLLRPWTSFRTKQKLRRLGLSRSARVEDKPLFLFPLQLPGDFQVRVHAPGGDHFKLVLATIESFSESAPVEAKLIFKIHPLDNGVNFWEYRINRWARKFGVERRVVVLGGGDLGPMLETVKGVVTINSTVGLTALQQGVPVITLGNAIYDVDELVSRQTLDDFWRSPERPDADLLAAYLVALRKTIQVRGSFVHPEGSRVGAAAVAKRILEGYPGLDRVLPKIR